MASAAPLTEVGYVKSSSSWWMELDEEQTPELRWPESIPVYDAMRSQDAQCASVLRAVTLPVRRTPWRLDPNGARDEVVEHVARDLGLPILGSTEPPRQTRTKDRFSWAEHLRMALLMLPFGHMYFAQWYRVSDDARRIHLRKLLPLMQRTIAHLEVAEDGGLVSLTQWPPMAGKPSMPIPVSRLVAYIHEQEGANWIGRSLLRPAYKHWLIKDRLLRVQAQTIERNGMGVPLYKGAPGEEDLSKGLAMAKAWRGGEAAGSAVANEADLLLRGVEGDLPDADKPIRYHDEQIGRAVLAHFLNLGTQTGSWALGTTFADFFTLSLQTLGQQIADISTSHVVEDLVDVNWGPEEPAPKITFQEIGSRRDATADAIKLLVDAGVIRTDEDLEGFVRDAFGLPGRGGRLLDPPAQPPAPAGPPIAASRRRAHIFQQPLPGLEEVAGG